jgi:hypothetical protein
MAELPSVSPFDFRADRVKTLLLDARSWDLVKDVSGNIALAGEPYSTDLALFEAARKDAVRSPMQQLCEARLAQRQGKGAQVVAFHREHVEGVKLDLVVEFAGMERVEIGDSVDAENDGLAVDDELLCPVLQRGLDDPGITLRPIVAAARDQPHAIAVALDAKTEAVIFHFVSGSTMLRPRRDRPHARLRQRVCGHDRPLR